MKGSALITLMNTLRVHQWPKNLLLFVALIAGHQVANFDRLFECISAFFSFSLCASALYVINDLKDLESDRAHPTKKKRPIASGAITPRLAILLAMLSAILSVALALTLPLRFRDCLVLYAASSLGYTLVVKRIIVLDIVALALLYTLRIFAGGAATGIVVSEWLLSFSLFFFSSLACLKRFSELRRLQVEQENSVPGRGYMTSDLHPIAHFGASAGCIAVLVLVLYVSSPQVDALYHDRRYLWFTTPIALFWVARMWILAFRGVVDEDPVMFAVYDKANYIIGLAAIALVYLAK